MSESHDLSEYAGKRVLITGGLGFLGSNVAHKLVPLGADVTVLDTLDPRYGGNRYNIEPHADRVRVVIGDVRDQALVEPLIERADVIFHFAAQVSYIDSLTIPFEDLDVDCRGQLVLLEACRKLNRRAKIVFSSSRMVLGRIIEDPMTEHHPTNPLSLYGTHKLTAEKYHQIYAKEFGIRSAIIRITNPYGHRQQIKHSKYSVPGWFMRLAMERKPISIFGDGKQLRDYIYVDDLVEAAVRLPLFDSTDGQIFNCGSGDSTEFREMVEAVVEAVGTGSVAYVPWPKDYEKIETGDFRTDISKLSQAIGWRPQVTLREGMRRMVAYYRAHFDHYVPQATP
jgi:UDP-glucose 4-epimerase